MILTHESGAQEDQFDGKKVGQKSRGTISLNSLADLLQYRLADLPLTAGTSPASTVHD
jgi:hypothetical protein